MFGPLCAAARLGWPWAASWNACEPGSKRTRPRWLPPTRTAPRWCSPAIAIFVPPLAFLAIPGFVVLLLGGRRREGEKYAGLRILR